MVVSLSPTTLASAAGDMSESKAHQVEIREVDGLTLRKLVDYIYTAEIEVTEDNVQVRKRSEKRKRFFAFLCLPDLPAASTTKAGF